MSKNLEAAKELRRIWGGFWSARVLLTANTYRIFDFVKSPKSAEETAKRLKIDLRATEILLDALTGLGLLKKTGQRYRNTRLANLFLVKGTPHYQGDIIRHAATLWQNWSGLDEVMRTGRPFHAAHAHDAFIRGMDNLALLKVSEVIREIDFRHATRVLDLGGGPGTYSIEMAKRGIAVTLFDRPDTIKISKEVIRKSGIKNIRLLQGDFLSDDIGEGYDLVFISQVLHSFSERENRRIIEKSRRALRPKGRIVIQEFFLGRDRTYPSQSSLFSVNMLVNTTGGRCYSPVEITQWLSDAGFGHIREKMVDDSVLISAENAR
jgi:ubiquinone/menaquinone biosynthesis C-methylase UbiE